MPDPGPDGDRQPLSRTPQPMAAEVARLLDEAAGEFEAGRLEAAARLYLRAERRAPGDIRPSYSLAVIDIRQGRLPRARRRLEAVVKAAPEHMPAQHNLGAVRQQLGDWTGAAAAFEAALSLRPDALETRQALAAALTILGRSDEAAGHYQVLARTPAARWAALTRLALIAPGAIDDEALAGMRAAVADQALDPETRTGLWFALGEALERRGAYDEAFEAFSHGNRLKRASFQPPASVAAQAHAAAAAHVRSLFTPDLLAGKGGQGSRTAAPIFVVGFPRSGSTLIEQILASHPQVQGLGETGLLPGLVEARYPSAGQLAGAKLRRLADEYLAGARERGWDGRSRFVDKTLENYLHVGLIHLMFPRAVILHAVRDPMDVGLSCYRQLFVSGNETLYDLADIGAEFRRYEAVMAHWREVLPGRVAEVSHEALVGGPEAGMACLLAAAGLPWDPAVLRFHERQGAVRTASATQVRQPMSQASLGRWRRYEAHLEPLKAALAR